MSIPAVDSPIAFCYTERNPGKQEDSAAIWVAQNAVRLGLFFAPLWGLHRKMETAKKERQAEVRGRLLGP